MIVYIDINSFWYFPMKLCFESNSGGRSAEPSRLSLSSTDPIQPTDDYDG